MKQKFLLLFIMTICSILLAIIMSGCQLFDRKQIVQDIADDVSLSDYFLGNWVSENAYYEDGEVIANKYELEVIDKQTLKFIVRYLDGDADGTNSEYHFISENKIFVDNIRITNGEVWLLERDGQKLIVARRVGDSNTIIVFTRSANKNQ